MKNNSTFKLSMAAIAGSLLVTACGGGGGGGAGGSDSGAAAGKPASGADTTAPASGTGTTPPSNTGSTAPSTGIAPVTSTPASTYDGTSFQAAAFKQLNNYRVAMGVGALKQDAALDTAAQAHALYLYSNFKAGTISTVEHNEIAGNANYYADTPLARAQKAGVSASEWVNESVALGASNVTPAAAAADCIEKMLNAVYHMVGLTYTQESVGLGYQPGAQTWETSACSVDMGTFTDVKGTPGPNTYSYRGGQQISTNAVVHLPLSNEEDVQTAMALEVPNPASDLSAPGHPVMVRVNAENLDTLSVQQFSLVDSAGVQVPARILVPASAQASSKVATVADPNNMLPNGSAVLLPLAPLKADTVYSATFNGTRDGVALPETTWSFTTGSN